MTMLLDIQSAAFGYTENKPVFSGLSFSIEAGDFICILGQNGCGKTTLLSCLNRTFLLDAGQILLSGRNIRSYKTKEIARKIGYVYQEHDHPFSFKVLDVVSMGRAPYIQGFSSPSEKDFVLAEQALEKIGIGHLKDRYFSRLSGGERQMVLIAQTICQDPDIIILDEPTNHLDFKNQAIILDIIKSLSDDKIGIIMTSHQPNHAYNYANKAALMKDGAFISLGSPGDVLTKDSLREIYDIDVDVFSVDDHPDYRHNIRFCFARPKKTAEVLN